MRIFKWNRQKNLFLKKIRGVSFEQVLYYIENDFVLNIIEHPNQKRYPDQRIYLILMNNYVYLVPFVDQENERFLKTIIPSRKLTKYYLRGEKDGKTK